MANPLDDMTQAKWDNLAHDQQGAIRDLGGLTSQLIGLEGKRVQVLDMDHETRRFWVGRSTGWRPCHLEIKTRRSTGGDPARAAYQAIVILDHGPR